MSADTLESLEALRDSLLEDADPAWQICERFLDFIEADRDRLAAELLAVREELGRVRRNHLRRMLKKAEEWREVFDGFQLQKMGDYGYEWRNHYGRCDRFVARLRAALSQPTKTGGG